MHRGTTPARERASLEAVAKQAERTLSADVDVVLDSEGALTITVELVSTDGPYRLVIDPQNLTVEILG